jgi:uncharacterized membrane protein YgaE (UPF0421/DUF939 family)
LLFNLLFDIFRDNQKRGVGKMRLKQEITIVRNCTTSAQMFAVAEALSHQISDLEDNLKDYEYEYNWTAIESCLKALAVTRYAYKFAYDAASEQEEFEHECELSAEINDAMMADRV